MSRTEHGNPVDCNNLYIKRLWNNCNQIELDDLFRPYGFIVQSRVCGNGVGFVRYETNEQAYKAMIALNNTKPHAKCKEPLVIRYAYKKLKKPKSEINIGSEKIEVYVHDNNKNVYIRNIPSFYTEYDLYNLCQMYGLISNVKLCRNNNNHNDNNNNNNSNDNNNNYNYGFIRFSTQDGAGNCIHSLHGKFLYKSHLPLIVKLANSDPFESAVDFQTYGSASTYNDISRTASPISTTASINSNNNNYNYNYNNNLIYQLPIQNLIADLNTQLEKMLLFQQN